MELHKLYAVAVVAVLSFSICESCSIDSRSYFFHKVSTGIYCKVVRADGGSFSKCEGSCVSSVKFDVVVNQTANEDLSSDPSRATAGCTGVQNCCKATATTFLGSLISGIALQYDPDFNSANCAERSADGLYIAVASGCACNPCRSTNTPPTSQLNNDRTLIPSSCKT